MKTYDDALERCYAGLEEKIKECALSVDIGRVRAAFETAVDSHSGQLRRDGSTRWPPRR